MPTNVLHKYTPFAPTSGTEEICDEIFFILYLYLEALNSIYKQCPDSSIIFQIGKFVKLSFWSNTWNMIWSHQVSLLPQHGFDYTGLKVLAKHSPDITGPKQGVGWLKCPHFYQWKHKSTVTYTPPGVEITRSLRVHSTFGE